MRRRVTGSSRRCASSTSCTGTRSLELYRTWRGKLRKRGAQMIVISTAGEPGGEFEEQRDRMRQMAGEVEREETFTRAVGDAFVLHDWAVPENGDCDDLQLVAKANPLSAVTVASLRSGAGVAGLEPGALAPADVQPAHPVGAGGDHRRRSGSAPRSTDEIPEGEPVYVGIDVGWKHDTTGIQPLWCRDSEYRLLDQGVTLTPPRDGNSLHPDVLKAALYKIRARNPIHKVVMDVSATRRTSVRGSRPS